MTSDEFITHLARKECWFNNGKQRSRKVVSWDGRYVYYLSPSKNTATRVLTETFAKWAKEPGIAASALPMPDRA